MANRRNGFSLVELSFVLVIMLILGGLVAGAGGYLTNEAHARQLADRSREILTALKGHEAANAAAGTPYPQPIDYDGADLAAKLARYVAPGSTAFNFYNNAFRNVSQRPYPVSTVAGNPPVGFASGDYPMVGNAGSVVYFFKAGAANGANIQIWNGTVTRMYQYYAVQTIDRNGYPLFTDGH